MPSSGIAECSFAADLLGAPLAVGNNTPRISSVLKERCHFLGFSLILIIVMNRSFEDGETDRMAWLSCSEEDGMNCSPAMPYGQFLRLRRICSDDDEYEAKSKEMASFFENRGYPRSVVTNSQKAHPGDQPRKSTRQFRTRAQGPMRRENTFSPHLPPKEPGSQENSSQELPYSVR